LNNTIKVYNLSQKVMQLQTYILSIKDEKEISIAKKEIIRLMQELDLVEADLDKE
jgi:intein-encoded DNA endonuclease-like protein